MGYIFFHRILVLRGHPPNATLEHPVQFVVVAVIPTSATEIPSIAHRTNPVNYRNVWIRLPADAKANEIFVFQNQEVRAIPSVTLFHLLKMEERFAFLKKIKLR